MKRLYDKALMEQIAKVYGNEITFLSEFSKALLDIIREGLIRDGEVRLHQFGVFKLKWMKARNGVNPGTGEKILIQAMPRVIFTPAKMLKETIEPEIPVLIPLDELNQPVTAEIVKPAVSKKTLATKENISERADNSAPVIAAVTTAIKQLKDSDTGDDQSAPLDTGKTAEPGTQQANAVVDIVAQDNKSTAPPKVIANIQDEIEILEQVVDILKSDQVKSASVGAATKDRKQGEASSQWLDASVVEKITELSELEYFRSASEDKTVTSDVIKTASELNRVEPESVAASKPRIQIEPDPDQINKTPKPEENERSSARWLAIAAAVVLVFSTAILFNRFSNTPDVMPVVTTDHAVITEQSVQIASTADSSQETEISLNETAVEADASSEMVNLEPAAVAADITPELSADQLEPVVDDSVHEVIVSEQNYEELRRVTAEQDVFFSEMEYKLLNGDSLWRLAKTHYVNPFYWPHIYQANHQRILNPDRVKIGRVIMLPTLFGTPDQLTKKDKRNIAMGYYYNYLYHKKRGDPHAYYSLIGVDKFDPELLIEYKTIIESSDVENLAMLLD